MAVFSHVIKRIFPQMMHHDQSYLKALGQSCATYAGSTRSYNSVSAEWGGAYSAAEKLVPPPRAEEMTVQSLLTDEMCSISTHLSKLIGSTHPLTATAKEIMSGEKEKTLRLLVLLYSKAVQSQLHETPQDLSSRQESLSEITEMIHCAYSIHRGIVDMDPSEPGEGGDLEHGNKIAILCGDYLLSKVCKALAQLHDSKVVALVSSAISDFSEAEFIGARDKFGRALPSTSYDVDFWRKEVYLSYGSLLSKSCKASLLLGGEGPVTGQGGAELQEARLEQAVAFGVQVAMALRARQELGMALEGRVWSCSSLPVVLHLQHEATPRNAVHALGQQLQGCQDPATPLQFSVSSAALEGTRAVLRQHCEGALSTMQGLAPSDAATALRSLVTSLQE